MFMNPEKLTNDLDLLDGMLDLNRGTVEVAINGDRYVEFEVTTHGAIQDRLERAVLNALNKAVDPDAYGIDTGAAGAMDGHNTSTYTIIYDKSSDDLDLISGNYDGYRNDLAGISGGDVPFAKPGHGTGIFLDGHAYRVAAPTAEIFGTPLNDWSENWWRWLYGTPATANPLLDQTGQNAGVDNDGPVFFVAGTPTNASAERTFAVPAGTPVLIPVLNFLAIPFDSDPPTYADETLAFWEPTVANLSATIDGQPVENVESYFVRTDYFSLAPPVLGSVLEAELEPFDLPASDHLGPSRGSGTYLMIEGLEPGMHTISFGGTSVFGPVSVTDYMIVT